MTQLHPDQWASRDLPVLLAIAERLQGPSSVSNEDVAAELGIAADEVGRSMEALVPTYLVATVDRDGGGEVFAFADKLTDQGRRATGLWPKEDAATDALIDLLNQAADTTTDEDDASNLRKAGRLLRAVPGAVVADVTAALIRQQAGI